MRMCVDFSHLNWACPKDSFALSIIEQLIDTIAGNNLLTFMDAFLGYNQIQMSPADQEKIAFRMNQGLYSYCMMPLGLKNVGATYQCLVIVIFKY